MQIVTSIEQLCDLNNMSIEEVIGRPKVLEERLRGYNDREEEKHFLLTHEEWLVRRERCNKLFRDMATTTRNVKVMGVATVVAMDV